MIANIDLKEIKKLVREINLKKLKLKLLLGKTINFVFTKPMLGNRSRRACIKLPL